MAHKVLLLLNRRGSTSASARSYLKSAGHDQNVNTIPYSTKTHMKQKYAQQLHFTACCGCVSVIASTPHAWSLCGGFAVIPRTTVEQQSHGDTASCKQSYVLMCFVCVLCVCVCVCRNFVTTEGVESALHAFNLHTHTRTRLGVAHCLTWGLQSC